MIRLSVSAAGTVLFFLLAFTTVRVFRPRDPKRFFLLYAVLLAVAASAVYVRVWPIATMDDALGLAAVVLAQTLACFTMWNSFYSLLWGFSGGLMHDLFTNETLRAREHLIRSYEGDGDVDRMMARRLPNMIQGGWLSRQGDRLTLSGKGRVIALGTLASYKFFSLGAGGGVK